MILSLDIFSSTLFDKLFSLLKFNLNLGISFIFDFSANCKLFLLGMIVKLLLLSIFSLFCFLAILLELFICFLSLLGDNFLFFVALLFVSLLLFLFKILPKFRFNFSEKGNLSFLLPILLI